MSELSFFVLSILVLAALLYYPVTKLVWVLSVRRMQRKLERELSEQEMRGQLNRARTIGVFLVLLFSWLYNVNMLGLPGHG